MRRIDVAEGVTPADQSLERQGKVIAVLRFRTEAERRFHSIRNSWCGSI
ncbi:hypothetical protein [Microvirga alba]|nr:hypothetical protein [Microvirga alba]